MSQITRMLAIKMLETATPQQRQEYEFLGAYARAEMYVKAYNKAKEILGEDGLQNLLQQKPGANPAEDPS